jgi:phytoene synthase
VTAGSATHAAAFLRDKDRERYFASLVLPAAVQPAVRALYAFNADVASVRERVSEPAPGEIRLQWWTDALKGAGHGDVRQNPLADALLDAIKQFDLPTVPLLRLITARRFDLYHDPMPDVPTFEGYAGETVSVLYQLTAMMLNDGQMVETGDAAGHHGVAQALVGHLRAFGYNAAGGRIFLPLSIFTANGVGEEEIFAGRISEGLLSAHRQLTDLARDHLQKAGKAIGELPRPLRSAFAPVTLLQSQLKRVEAGAEHAFATPADLADWQKLAMLAWWNWRGR